MLLHFRSAYTLECTQHFCSHESIIWVFLQGVDKLAHIRKVESLYLHVDVTNEAAINLYTKAGYVKAEPTPSNLQFTRSLNLHDGATNGRNHYLMCKHLRIPTILDNEKNTNQIDDKHDIGNAIKNSLGFEMPS